jgi:hypothetical protein
MNVKQDLTIVLLLGVPKVSELNNSPGTASFDRFFVVFLSSLDVISGMIPKNWITTSFHTCPVHQ